MGGPLSKYGQYMDIIGLVRARGVARARRAADRQCQWAAARRIDLDRLKKGLQGWNLVSQGSVQWNPCIPRLTQSPGLDYF